MTQMALVIDLNVCVGCHACVTSCKEWNTSGEAGSLADFGGSSMHDHRSPRSYCMYALVFVIANCRRSRINLSHCLK